MFEGGVNGLLMDWRSYLRSGSTRVGNKLAQAVYSLRTAASELPRTFADGGGNVQGAGGSE